MVCLLIIVLVLFFRLGFLQISNKNNIRNRAYNLWGRDIPIEGQRGNIYDRNGVLIVGSTLAPSIAIMPRQVENKSETANYLAKVLNVSSDDIMKHLDKNVSIELIKPEGRKISIDQATKIIEKNLPGVYVVGDTKRYYPYDSYLAQVLGFTGIDNQGVAGLEYIYDEYLMGSNGNLTIYTDGKGYIMDALYNSYNSAKVGLDLYLTIDMGLQLILEKVLKNAIEYYDPEQVLGVVVHPKTGEVYAMSSYPTFSPANYQDYDPDIYNRNLPIWMAYEPGSTFKIITYAMGLNEGVFKLDEKFYDPGYAIVDGARLKDWKAGGHGEETFLEVIQNSCNPGFVEIGLRLGEERFLYYLNKFGFGKKTGIDLLGESAGIIFNEKVMGNVELATSAFGQGNAVTPIQLVTATSAAINGGFLYTPYVVKGLALHGTTDFIYERSPILKDVVIRQDTSAIVRQALESVVAYGTGRGAYIEKYRVGGKTGTAQKAVNGSYLENNYIVSFIGAAPMDDPELVCYIAIDNPKGVIQYGGVVAAPLVRNFLVEALPYLNIPERQNELHKLYRYWQDITYFDAPNLVGLDKKDLKESTRYKLQIYGSGTKVISQIPEAGSRIPEGGTVIVYLN